MQERRDRRLGRQRQYDILGFFSLSNLGCADWQPNAWIKNRAHSKEWEMVGGFCAQTHACTLMLSQSHFTNACMWTVVDGKARQKSNYIGPKSGDFGESSHHRPNACHTVHAVRHTYGMHDTAYNIRAACHMLHAMRNRPSARCHTPYTHNVSYISSHTRIPFAIDCTPHATRHMPQAILR